MPIYVLESLTEVPFASKLESFGLCPECEENVELFSENKVVFAFATEQEARAALYPTDSLRVVRYERIGE